MDQATGGILQAVANPKQFIFAPFEMAIVNIIFSVMVMLLLIAVLGITPFWALIPLVGGHIALIVFGTQNPHLTTTLRATGVYPPGRKNRVKVKSGVKYTV